MNCTMKKCCWCFPLRTGSMIIATVGILLTVTALVPHCQLIQNHDYYIREYVKRQRAEGLREISDEDIPKIDFFSRITWSLVIAYDALYIFFSLLLLVGIAASTRLLMIPWMFLAMITILSNVIFVLSVMFALGNFGSIITFILTFPFFAFVVYVWFAVYSTYKELGSSREISVKEETRGLVNDIEVGVINPRVLLESSPSITVITNHNPNGHHSPESRVIALSGSRHSVVSSSTSSMKSECGLLRGTHIQRTILGTPPPPYEVVALSKNKVALDDENIKSESKSETKSESLSLKKTSNGNKLTTMSSISSSTSSTEKVSSQPSIEEPLSSAESGSLPTPNEPEALSNNSKETSDKEEDGENDSV